MIALNQDLLGLDRFQALYGGLRISEGEIAKYVQSIASLHFAVDIVNDRCIHFLDRLKLGAARRKNIFVSEMRVRNKHLHTTISPNIDF